MELKFWLRVFTPGNEYISLLHVKQNKTKQNSILSILISKEPARELNEQPTYTFELEMWKMSRNRSC